MRQHGHHVRMATVHHLIGMAGDKLLEECLGADRDTDEDDALTAAHLSLYRQHWGRLSPLPGVRDLLRACAERGLNVVLASSASEEELGALMSAIDADDAITTATSSEDADAGKPAPDILEAALEQSGLDAEHVVFIGDAVWDGHAAKRAGTRFVGLTCGGTPGSELREAGAVELWSDPAELLADIDQSVLGTL
ncbi:MAG: HAD family hydrolase [Actinomycetota bacterium]|nr:HAD family hydrolase [Actinomycetota bacterium]